MTVRAAAVRGVSEALNTISNRPMRALLAALAMAAAVATTAIVQTALNGLAREARQASARAFGSDSFVLTRYATGNLSRRELAVKIERNAEITRSDVRFLENVAEGRVTYAATVQQRSDVDAGGRTFENATVNGTQAALLGVRDVAVARGRFFTKAEETNGALVAVVGAGVVDALFPTGEPLGGIVRIGNRPFRIVGILERQGSSGGVSLDRYVWMPITAFERTFGTARNLQVFAKATDVARTGAAEDHARASMRARRHLSPGAPDTFDLITPEASRSFVTAITERIGAAGPPISFMALFAAIIVVTNTTLVSVTQRMREIGIRRALGAKRVSILFETVAESSVIALIGGIVGVLVATVALSVASRALAIPLSLEWPTMVGSLFAAGLSGVVSGWYPARRAVALDVITALRQE